MRASVRLRQGEGDGNQGEVHGLFVFPHGRPKRSILTHLRDSRFELEEYPLRQFLPEESVG